MAAAMLLAPLPAEAQYAALDVERALLSADGADRDVRTFYQARGYRPLWIRNSSLGPEADRLLDLIETAGLDGLRPKDYRPKSVASAIRKARGGSPRELVKAELLLSRTFAEYVRDVRQPRDTGMIYAHPGLAPAAPTINAILQAAASAPSFEEYMESEGWAHPIYAQLRDTLAYHKDGFLSARQEQLLRLNLDRARALPAPMRGKYILVDAAAARLWMYEDGRARDSMKVIVGKPAEQTPMMAGMVSLALVNPYWNVPPDLVRARIAPNVLKDGNAYLKTKGYQLLSDWTEKATVLDPSKVDWQAVAAGREELRVRQLPGGDNAMGKMKFMFPNDLGIYLHDTPDKELFDQAERQFSSGCVRLEDAQRLAKWLFGKPLKPRSNKPEQQVKLRQPVPVYITYLTASPEGPGIMFRSDVYHRDLAKLAAAGSRGHGRR